MAMLPAEDWPFWAALLETTPFRPSADCYKMAAANGRQAQGCSFWRSVCSSQTRWPMVSLLRCAMLVQCIAHVIKCHESSRQHE